MDEYIGRDEFIEAVKDIPMWGSVVAMFADGIPAADVAPVVHGRWVTYYRSGTPVAEGYVSTCCDMWNNRKSDYCPHCGAIMDGGADNAAD